MKNDTTTIIILGILAYLYFSSNKSASGAPPAGSNPGTSNPNPTQAVDNGYWTLPQSGPNAGNPVWISGVDGSQWPNTNTGCGGYWTLAQNGPNAGIPICNSPNVTIGGQLSASIQGWLLSL